MNKNDLNSKESVGLRYMIFRKAIRKSSLQISEEIEVPLASIQAVESGSSFPDIVFLHNLFIEYGLNINWLLFNAGWMFSATYPANLDSQYVMRPISSVEEVVAQHTSFIMLLQIPIIEKAVQDALDELRLELQKDGNK